MRFIYLDEAGTSRPEPVSVVAGPIVNADTQYVALERAITQALTKVPERHRARGFVPHAKSIFHGEGDLRDGWDRASRRALVRELVGIAPSLGVPVAVGMCRRALAVEASHAAQPHDVHHMLAFGLCVGHADRQIVIEGKPNEVAAAVVENAPRQQSLAQTFAKMKADGIVFVMQHGGDGSALGEAETVRFTVERIRDAPHFVPKTSSPLLWLADATAFAVARYLSGDESAADVRGVYAHPCFTAFRSHGLRDFGSVVMGSCT